MVASIITEHPRIEFRFITSPSGRCGYPNYRPGFSHIKKVALPKTSHLNKGWIRKSFAFFPSFPFWKVFCTFFSLWCFVLCWGAAVFFSGFAPRPCGGKIRSLVGFWEGSGGRNICWEQDVCNCVCVWVCACRDTALASHSSSQICLSVSKIVGDSEKNIHYKHCFVAFKDYIKLWCKVWFFNISNRLFSGKCRNIGYNICRLFGVFTLLLFFKVLNF